MKRCEARKFLENLEKQFEAELEAEDKEKLREIAYIICFDDFLECDESDASFCEVFECPRENV